jgi:RNA polymerase sigma factor (sigma-70 family)
MNHAGPELLAQLLDEHGDPLVLYARQWCDSPEDVVQEALVALFRQPENVVGWLYRVVRNAAISAARASQRRSRHESAAAGVGAAWFVSADDARLDAQAAADALGNLPLEQREVIVARLWGCLSFEEIARLNGKPLSTVHRWYHAGLTALRERLESPCPQKHPTRSL